MREAERLPNAEIERRLLSALCATALAPEMRALILERLSAHTFANRDHEIICQALAKIPLAPAEHIRETLSARLTRLGFPDIDVEPILEFSPPPPDTIAALLQHLDR